MKLVMIFGSAAVGKMTVGQELCKITDLKLFHNHMSIEPVIEIFGYYDKRTIDKLREVVFDEFCHSNNYGMVFTFMFDFDDTLDWEYTQHVADKFKSVGGEVYYVELVANQEERLRRNSTQNRLDNKPSKRDLDVSNARLIKNDREHRLASYDNEMPFDNYIKIDNTNLPAITVAQMIKERFSL